jgi:hypothetical protein
MLRAFLGGQTVFAATLIEIRLFHPIANRQRRGLEFPTRWLVYVLGALCPARYAFLG